MGLSEKEHVRQTLFLSRRGLHLWRLYSAKIVPPTLLLQGTVVEVFGREQLVVLRNGVLIAGDRRNVDAGGLVCVQMLPEVLVLHLQPIRVLSLQVVVLLVGHVRHAFQHQRLERAQRFRHVLVVNLPSGTGAPRPRFVFVVFRQSLLNLPELFSYFSTGLGPLENLGLILRLF